MNRDKISTEPIRPALSRRHLIRSAAALAAIGTTPSALAQAQAGEAAPQRAPDAAITKGRIKQSVCRWCYGGVSLDELCAAAAAMGLVGIDLCGPSEFTTLEKHGLVCTMVSSHGLQNGLCDPRFHAACIRELNQAIEAAATAGYKNVITFSGNRRGIDDKKGMEHCAQALKEIVPFAEKKGVTLCMELLNSRVNHQDYMCDTSAWGVELVKRVGSDHFRLLYDIYHMQIMEGDLIRTIERDHQYFGHYHTAGNPGRNEMDDSQELNYPPIIKAIIDTGYTGYLGQEFIPKHEPLQSLRDMVRLCDV